MKYTAWFAGLWLSLVATAGQVSAQGTVFMTVPEALELAFPECEVKRTRVVVTKAQQDRVTELAGDKLTGKVVRPYVAKKDGKVVGTAYFDAHRVRTKRQVLMIVVTPTQKIERLEVLAFAEPTDYIPRESWYELFEGRQIDDELRMNSAIRQVTGATLTTRATTEAARRVLALHRVLNGAPQVAKDAKSDEAASKKSAAKKAGAKATRTGHARSIGAAESATRRDANGVVSAQQERWAPGSRR